MGTQSLRLEQRSVGDFSWFCASTSLSFVEHDLVAEVQSKILPVVRPDWTPRASRYRVLEMKVTKSLLGFFQAGKAEDMVLVKVTGDEKELFMDIETEVIVILTLHKAGLSPPLYLVAENALCYGYVPGRTLTVDDLEVRYHLCYHLCRSRILLCKFVRSLATCTCACNN